MTRDSSADRLWHRYRCALSSTTGAPAAEAPGPTDLAAYAEGRGSRREQARIEAWLARHPEVLGDILAARRARYGSTTRPYHPGLLDRMMWGTALAMMIVTAWAGFDLGQASAQAEMVTDSDTLIIGALFDQQER